MKSTVAIIFALFVLQLNAQIMETVDKIIWFGQAAIEINNDGQKIFIDPYNLPYDDAADIILITHSHGDHLSVDDIRMVLTRNTHFVCPENCQDALSEAGFENITTVAPGDKITIEGVNIEAVPMYNLTKTNFHPRENSWCGYIVEIDGIKIYHAGDTERVPEMKELDCDIALLPLGQTYTMNSVEEAAEAALDTGAELVIPIHYGTYEGTEADAQNFKAQLDGKLEVVILEPRK